MMARHQSLPPTDRPAKSAAESAEKPSIIFNVAWTARSGWRGGTSGQRRAVFPHAAGRARFASGILPAVVRAVPSTGFPCRRTLRRCRALLLPTQRWRPCSTHRPSWTGWFSRMPAARRWPEMPSRQCDLAVHAALNIIEGFSADSAALFAGRSVGGRLQCLAFMPTGSRLRQRARHLPKTARTRCLFLRVPPARRVSQRNQ